MSTDSTSTTAAAGPVLTEQLGLVERLRQRYRDSKKMLPDELCHEAADEIQRLRDALDFVARNFSSDWPQKCQVNVLVARRALAERK